jgi:rubrerythrin
MDNKKIEELICQAIATEKGGVQVYETALRCVVNEDLKKEWTKYLDQTKTHVEVVTELAAKLGLDPELKTPGALIVELKGKGLVAAMEEALRAGDAAAAELVAAECVVDAETKDHTNWELIGEAAKGMAGEQAKAMREACEEVEDEEDEHLYHTMGWTRELWLQFLGRPAVLPPPEEKKHVETAIGAARAKAERGRMVRKSGAPRGRKLVKKLKAKLTGR